MPYLLLPLLLTLASCATKQQITEVDQTPKWTPDTRVAQAFINTGDVSQIQGQIFFEQMPNSVIVSYHIEGLQPKSRYQIFLHKNQTCGSLNATAADAFVKLRARPDGVAENTFKTDTVTVAKGADALAGDAIVIRSLDEELGSFPPAVACAEIRPQEPTVAVQ